MVASHGDCTRRPELFGVRRLAEWVRVESDRPIIETEPWDGELGFLDRSGLGQLARRYRLSKSKGLRFCLLWPPV